MQIRNLKIRPTVSIVLLIMVTFFFQPSSVEGASLVRTNKGIYKQGEAIQVYFSNAPGNDRDWICIVPAGSPDTDGGDYKYMPRGLGKGSLIFDPRSLGQYEVRAYYNYRRNGYVVSDRYAFSVVGDPVKEGELVQGMEPIVPNNSFEANLPPPIPFDAPPNVVVLPGTDIYAVPDFEGELFFQGGWWWRPWGGHWYRSQYHDHGWAYYRDSPSWYGRIPRDWRSNYSNHIWGGRTWNPPHINQGNLDNHWRGGYWRSNTGLGRPKPSRPPVDRVIRGSDPGRSTLPGSIKPGGDPGRRTLNGGPGGGTVKPNPRGDGKPGDGRNGRNLRGGTDGRTLRDGRSDGRTQPNGRMDRGDGGGSHRGDRR
jgi:hypothetical protein